MNERPTEREKIPTHPSRCALVKRVPLSQQSCMDYGEREREREGGEGEGDHSLVREKDMLT